MKSIQIIILALALLFTGCEDKLDLYPKTQVSDGSFWNSAADFEIAANALYNSLPSRSMDADSDIQFTGNSNPISSGTNLPVESDGVWKNSYEQIRKSTYIIEQSEAKPQINAKRYVAEARFFRALTYYDLLARYGDVPLIKSVLSIDSEELKMARTPRSEVVNFIISELKLAVADLPNRSQFKSANELGRISKGAANTLMAKVVLFEGTWSKYNKGTSNVNELLTIAKNAANDVITSNEYALYNAEGTSSYRKLFMNPLADDDNFAIKPEHILARRYRKDLVWHSFAQVIQANAGPTKKLVDMYLCKDGLPIDKSPLFQSYTTFKSEYENRDLRMNNTIAKIGDVIWRHDGAETLQPSVNSLLWSNTGYRIYKFITEGPERITGKDYNDHEILRYAEVLLIYAEATYELSGTITNADLNKSINLLRERAGIAPLTNELVNSNMLNMLTEIRRERTVELALEGERLLDLKRWGIVVQEMVQPIKGIQFNNSDWSKITTNGKLIKITDITSFGVDIEGFIILQPATTRMFTNKNLLFPLPLQELKLNTNLVQNPGWN